MKNEKIKFELHIIIKGEAEREQIDALMEDLKRNPLLKDLKISMTPIDDDSLN